MGYYISCNASDFRMRKENLSLALKALQTEAAKPGNNWDWVGNDEILKAKSFAEAMQAFSWWPVTVANKRTDGLQIGDVSSIYFDGEKIGSEGKLFEIISPFVESGSYVECTGEEGEFWRYVFKNGKMTKEDGVRAWEDWESILSLVLDRADKANQLPTFLKLHPTLDGIIAERLKKKPKRKKR